MTDETIIVKPSRRWDLGDIREIWKYRELLYVLTWRDIKVRYKQTLLGIIWVIFQPSATTVVFTIFFGNLAKIPSGNLPYSLFVLSGLVFWSFFSNSLSNASGSLTANEGIIKKVYFPKIILPLASITISFFDFLINLVILFIFAFILGFYPSISALLIIPLAIIITSISAAGLGFFLASVNVKYRDVRYILPYFIQILLFLSPIIYPLTIVSSRNKYILALNPMTAVVETVRTIFSHSPITNIDLILISISISILIFIFGYLYFKKTEKYISDEI